MSKPQKHYGTWRARWTDEHGARHIRSFVDYREADLFLAKGKLRIREVRLGLRAPSMVARTFDHAADYWEAHRAPRKRSCKDDISILKQMRVEFGGLPLNDTPAWVEAVDRYAERRSHLDPKTVGNHLTLLGTILRAAQDLGWLERLPRIKKPKVRLITADFSYLRTEEERVYVRGMHQRDDEAIAITRASARDAFEAALEFDVGRLDEPVIRWADRDQLASLDFGLPDENYPVTDDEVPGFFPDGLARLREQLIATTLFRTEDGVEALTSEVPMAGSSTAARMPGRRVRPSTVATHHPGRRHACEEPPRC